ncbi:MAG: type II secretion system protein [Methylotenera sp.]|nr:type II secretion system protein [Methylotenera sp.]MDP2402456.1 type II secretion system protein [Methylotenera sp.]MDZ4222337.1 type II secretion system protein [Methylotenera sp.]
MSACFKTSRKGFTLIELVVTVAIVAILASVAMPMLQLSVQRVKESELRTNLRQIREALDAYKKAVDEGRIKKTIEQSGYPPNLTVLVDGVLDEKDPNKHKLKFLRKVPTDPMSSPSQNANNYGDSGHHWGLRSYASEASNPTEGEDVFDVYSLSQQVGINGIPYSQW